MGNFKTVFVEGMDCVGKSTLIENILNERDLTHHFEFPLGATDNEKYYFQYGQFEAMFRNLKYLTDITFMDFFSPPDISTKFVFDRSHIGEYVWGPYYRKKFPIYLPKLEHMHYQYCGDCVTNVLMICSDEKEIIKRFAERDEDIPEDWMKLQDMFIEAVENISPFDYLIYDTAILNEEEIALDVTKDLNKLWNPNMSLY